MTPYPSPMARRRSARHTRPTGRRALEASHAQLEDDVSSLRAQRYADHLELVRLTALVEGLVSHVQRLAIELAEMRRDLQIARTAPQQRDPAVAQLAAQVADLRATVAVQQSMLSELGGRLLDVMGRLGPDPWAAHRDATHPPYPDGSQQAIAHLDAGYPGASAPTSQAVDGAPTTAYDEVAATPELEPSSQERDRLTLEPTMAEMAALARGPVLTYSVESPAVVPVTGDAAGVEPTYVAPSSLESSSIESVAPDQAVVEPAVVEPSVVEPGVVEPAAVAPAPTATTRTGRVPATDLRDRALLTVPGYPPPAADGHVVTLTEIPASVSAGAAEMSRREPILAEVAAANPGYRHLPAPASDVEALDDETVLRLRMIRESFGR